MTQRFQRFLPDQRWNLTHYERMRDYISQEFYAYNKAFFSPNGSRVVKNWNLEVDTGLVVKVNQGTDSTLITSDRANFENFIWRKTTDDELTITLTDNATNYVEVQLVDELCAEDTVTLWDPTANNGDGAEYTQTAMTVNEQKPYLVSNTTGFTGDDDKLPLATITTVGGAVTLITDSRLVLFELEDDWAFGSTRTDRTIGSLKDAYDALATSIKELKGATNWYDLPTSSLKILKEYQNMFISGGGTITWAPSVLTWSSTINFNIAGRAATYTLAAGNKTIADGEAMYVTIPDALTPTALTASVAALSAVPLNPGDVGFGPGIQVLFYRSGTTLYGGFDLLPNLETGESGVIGQDLSAYIRARLGITSDIAYEAYSSTKFIGTTDSYPAAISKLDKTLDSPCRLYANATATAVLNISASQVVTGNDSAKNSPPIGVLIATSVASTINFQTRSTSGATFNVSWPTSTVGKFRRLGFTKIANGSISMTFSAEAVTVGGLADPGTVFVSGGIPIGWIDLEATATTPTFKTAGSATAVIENSVSGTARIVNIAGGGGNTGGGTGLASGGITDAVFPLTIGATSGLVIRLNTSAYTSQQSATLPAPTANFLITFVDVGFNLSALYNAAPVNLARNNPADTIGGLAADYLLEANGGKWSLIGSGTGWDFVA